MGLEFFAPFESLRVRILSASTSNPNPTGAQIRIAILEFLCGGGTAQNQGEGDDIHALLGEGRSMLMALAEDLLQSGHVVVVALDARLPSPLAPDSPHAESLVIRRIHLDEDWLSAWSEIACAADRVIVIAPEIDGILGRIAHQLRATGARIHLSSDSFLHETSDKYLLFEKLKGHVEQPPTYLASSWNLPSDPAERTTGTRSDRSPTNIAADLDRWILKDRLGAGCVGTKLIVEDEGRRNGSRWDLLAEYLKGEDPDRWIIQPWIEGVSASLAVLAKSSQDFQLVGCMGQRIEAAHHVTYLGGYGPLLDEHRSELHAWVASILSHLPGALGWIGVDFILQPERTETETLLDRLVFLEINPRLTSSYQGYRALFGATLGEACAGIETELKCRGGSNLDKITFTV